jgi:hypothetical protein
MADGNNVMVPIGTRYPSTTPAGKWKVHVDSPQYRAWKWWLQREFRKEFFPEPVMVVWSEWPPRSWDGARMVAEAITAIRNSEDIFLPKHRNSERPPIGGEPVPPNPEPWDGYIPLPSPVPVYADNLAERRRKIIEEYLANKNKFGPTWRPERLP